MPPLVMDGTASTPAALLRSSGPLDQERRAERLTGALEGAASQGRVLEARTRGGTLRAWEGRWRGGWRLQEVAVEAVHDHVLQPEDGLPHLPQRHPHRPQLRQGHVPPPPRQPLQAGGEPPACTGESGLPVAAKTAIALSLRAAAGTTTPTNPLVDVTVKRTRFHKQD